MRVERSNGVATPHRWQSRVAELFQQPLALWLLIGCVGCHAAAPPPPPEPPPPPPPPVVVAPPPPKCEKVEEGCVAKADTRARIGQMGWQFAPPVGWIYAQGESSTVASGRHAVLSLTVRPTGDVKKERNEREGALRTVASQLGVLLPKKKAFIPKKPDKKEKVADIDVDFYQVEGAKLEGQTGPLIFFVAKASREQVLVGIGFVPDNDSDNSDQAILAAIESLGPARGQAAAGKVP